MINYANEKILKPVSKYTVAFILLILAGANVYQYTDGRSAIVAKDLEIKVLNDKLRAKDEEALKIERERAQRYEYLLNNLPKITYQNEEKNVIR